MVKIQHHLLSFFSVLEVGVDGVCLLFDYHLPLAGRFLFYVFVSPLVQA